MILGELMSIDNNELTKDPPSQPINPAEQFDVTRKARQEALNSVQEVLNRAVQGGKVNQSQLVKALYGLHDFAKLTDALLIAVLNDMVTIIRAIAGGEANTFACTSKLKAMVDLLEEKKLLTEIELIEMHDKKTLPKIIEKMKEKEELQMQPKNNELG